MRNPTSPAYPPFYFTLSSPSTAIPPATLTPLSVRSSSLFIMRAALPVLLLLGGAFQWSGSAGISQQSLGGVSVVAAAPSFLPKGSIANPSLVHILLNTRHGDDEDEEMEEHEAHSHSADEHSAMTTDANTTVITPPTPPSSHSHAHSDAPALKVLNETAILLGHPGTDLPSYWDLDLVYGSDDPRLEGKGKHGVWSGLHMVSMLLAYFFILPVGEFVAAI